MRALTIIILIIGVCPSLLSQQLQVEVNGNIVTLDDEHITSDFGRREVSSKFHDGIDFSTAGGDGELDSNHDIKSISTGIVREISVPTSTNYKVIIIDDANAAYGYGHIFRNNGLAGATQLGNFLIHYSSSLEDNVIIVYPDNESETYALTDIQTLNDLSFVYNGVNYSAQNGRLRNYVNKGQKIAPIGDSGTGSAHIHLYRFRRNIATDWTNDDNLIDPLFYLNNHTSPFNYEVDIEIENSGSFSINPSFKLRADFSDWSGGSSNENYTSASNDLSQAKILIRSFNNSRFELIEGAFFESRISEGATPFTDSRNRYPKIGSPLNNNNVDIGDAKTDQSNAAGYGTYEMTGIVGASYAGNFNQSSKPHLYYNAYEEEITPGAWDDYFFNDFPTRINKEDEFGRTNPNMASKITEARYPDGEYIIVGEVENIYGIKSKSDPESLIIDNFRPFVKEVTIFTGGIALGSTTVFHGKFNEDTNQIDQEDINEIEASDPLLIQVKFSEPMNPSSVRARISSQGTYYYSNSNSSDKCFYTIEIPPIGTAEIEQSQTLFIDAQDLYGNSLQTNPADVPTRTGETTWTTNPAPSPGEDSNYTFNGIPQSCDVPPGGGDLRLVKSASTGECIFVAFQVDKQNPAVYEPVVFSPIGSTDPSLTYNWDFGVGAIPATSSDREVTVMYTSDGSKTVELEICSGGNCAVEEVVSYLNVGPQNGPITINSISVDGQNRGYGNIGDNFVLTANVTNYVGNLSYSWMFDDGSFAIDGSSSSPNVSYSNLGNKTITLTVWDDNGNTITRSFENKITILNYPPLVVDIDETSCLDFPFESSVTFNAFVTGGKPESNANKTYFWSFGDGGFSESAIPQYTFQQPGNYTVSLIVCDEYGCGEDQIEQCIYIGENQTSNSGFWNILLDANGIPVPIDACTSNPNKPQFAVGEPIFFDINVDKGGGGKDEDYTYIWDFNAPGLCTGGGLSTEPSPSTARSEPSNLNYPQGPRTQTVYYNAPGVYEISIVVSSPVPGYNSTSEIFQIEIIDGIGSTNCRSGLGNISISSNCWDVTNPPTLSFIEQFSNCNIDKIDLFQIINGSEVLAESNITSGIILDFDWNGGAPDLENNFILKTYSGPYVSGINAFDVSFAEKPVINPITSYSVCTGAATAIGMTESIDYSYNWSAVSGSDLNFLSDVTSSNPTFVAYNDGTYQYDLTVSDKVHGCSTTERITINTSGIQSQSYGTTVSAGRGSILESPAVGGGDYYEYSWSPTTYLDNPQVANPIINAPPFETSITYTVDITFRDCSASVATVDVEVENLPPSHLEVEDETSVFPSLNWRNNGVANEIRILRSGNGVNWDLIGTVDGETEEYQDITCSLSYTDYEYRVEGYDILGNFMGNPVNQTHVNNLFVEGVVRVPPYTLQVDVGTQRPLTPSVNGDLSVFTYDWGSSVLIDDPSLTFPTFSALDYGSTYQFDVIVDYQGICSAIAPFIVEVINYESTNLSVSLNGQFFPELTWDNDPRGILKSIEVQRSFNGGPFVPLSSTAGIDADYIDVDCLETGLEVCYQLRSIDLVDATVGFSNIACVYIPYNPEIVQTLEHTLPGNGRATNKKSLFEGFGGNTTLSTTLMNDIRFVAVDANTEYTDGTEESYFQLLFKNALHEDIQSSVVVNANASIEFYPTSIAETNAYIYAVGYYERSDLPANSAFVFRYNKSNGSVASKRLFDDLGNPIELTHPPKIATVGETPIIGLTKMTSSGYSNVELRALLDWSSNQWDINDYSNFPDDRTVSDLDTREDQIYLFWKTGDGNYDSENLSWYYLDENGIIQDLDESRGMTLYSSPENDPIHPQLLVHKDRIYYASEGIEQTVTNFTIHIEKRNFNLSLIWETDIPISNHFSIRSFLSFQDELIIIGQRNNEVVYFSVDEDGNLNRYESFIVSDLDYVLGAEIVNDDLLITYIRNSAQASGEVATLLLRSQSETLGAYLTICDQELLASSSYAGYEIYVAGDCNLEINNTEQLSLETSNKMQIKPGFRVEPGGTFSASIIDIQEIVCNESSGDFYYASTPKVDIDRVSDTPWTSELVISAYPNPTNEYIRITQDNLNSAFVHLTMMDLQGNTIYEKLINGVTKLDERLFVGDLVKGLYILKIENQHHTTDRKILIQ